MVSLFLGFIHNRERHDGFIVFVDDARKSFGYGFRFEFEVHVHARIFIRAAETYFETRTFQPVVEFRFRVSGLKTSLRLLASQIRGFDLDGKSMSTSLILIVEGFTIEMIGLSTDVRSSMSSRLVSGLPSSAK